MENKIRLATANDLPAILEIVNYNILHTVSLYDYDARTPADMLQWLDDKENNGWPVLIAEQEGELKGYATYGPFRPKEANKYTIEHSVYVAHNAVGHGIGSILLRALIALAKEQGYHTIIGCIDAENKGSIRFHEHFGFKDAGLLTQVGFKFGRWLDLQFMQLVLK